MVRVSFSDVTKLTLGYQNLSNEGEIYWSHYALITRKSLDLDMCRYVFSKVDEENRPIVMWIVPFIILTESVSLTVIASFFDVSRSKIRTMLSGLSPFIDFQGDDVVFVHPSLSAFLLNEGRSQTFYVSPIEWKTRLCIISLKTFISDWKGKFVFAFDTNRTINLTVTTQRRRVESTNIP